MSGGEDTAPVHKLRKKASFANFLRPTISASIAGIGSGSPRALETPVRTPTPSKYQRSTRRELPPWDRTVDVVYHQFKHGELRPDKEKEFEKTVKKFLADHNREQGGNVQSSYLHLPAYARFQICRLLMADETWSRRSIGLTNRRFNHEVWPPGYFAELGDALVFLRLWTNLCYELYADMMVTFLMTNRFHVIFSPFVGPLLNPLATRWLQEYGQYMQHITLELDMSKLGLGQVTGDAKFQPVPPNMDRLIRGFVEEQLKRKSHSTIANFVLLCRRFYGDRPAVVEALPETQKKIVMASTRIPKSPSLRRKTKKENLNSPSPSKGDTESAELSPNYVNNVSKEVDDSVENSAGDIMPNGTESSKDIQTGRSGATATMKVSFDPEEPKITMAQGPYCSEEALALCDPIFKLRGLVDSIRICGFTVDYTNKLLQNLFVLPLAEELKYHSYCVSPSTLWPRLHGQSSWVDIGKGKMVEDNHVLPGPPGLLIHSTGPVVTPPPWEDPQKGLTLTPDLGIVDVNSLEVPEGPYDRGRRDFMSSEGSDGPVPQRSKSKVRRMMERLRWKSKATTDTNSGGNLRAKSFKGSPKGKAA